MFAKFFDKWFPSNAEVTKRNDAMYDTLTGFDPETMVADHATLGARIEAAEARNFARIRLLQGLTTK